MSEVKITWQSFLYHNGKMIFLSVITSGLLANVVTSLLGGVLISVIEPIKKNSFHGKNQSIVSVRKDFNYRDLKRNVIERNLFNSNGEVPDEPDPGEVESIDTNVFDANASCSKSSLNISLVGLIYLGKTGPSIASIREKGVQVADLYKVGEEIIDHSEASIHEIEENRIIINNNGKKECLELAPPEAPKDTVFADKPKKEVSGDVGSTVTLTEKYVTDQLGAGLENAFEKGRLVPVTEGGQVLGFKLISMDPKSLFGKIGLKNGDIITQVNDISLKQPDQGFAFYQAFQDERDIQIGLLRDKTNAISLNISIVE